MANGRRQQNDNSRIVVFFEGDDLKQHVAEEIDFDDKHPILKGRITLTQDDVDMLAGMDEPEMEVALWAQEGKQAGLFLAGNLQERYKKGSNRPSSRGTRRQSRRERDPSDEVPF